MFFHKNKRFYFKKLLTYHDEYVIIQIRNNREMIEMLKPTHERVGIITPLVLMLIAYYYLDTRITILGIILTTVFSLLGSTFPDIDQKQSTSGRRFFLLSWFIRFWGFIGRKLHISTISRATDHRGITHSLIIPVFIYTVYYFLSQKFNFYHSIDFMVNGFFLGILTHLITDMLNPTGIPLFAPFSYIKFNIAKIKTGSSQENFFRGAFTFFAIVISLYVLLYKSDKFYEIIMMAMKPETYTNLFNQFWNWLGSI